MRKKFDSVGFQREIREELSRKYNADREAFLKDLNGKYGVLKKTESVRTSDNRAHTANAKT